MLDMAKVEQRILVITDNMLDEHACFAPLRNSGCRIEVANDVEEAVRLTNSLRPTMVLVDDALNELSTNALELSMKIRSAVPSDETPVIIMAPSCDTVCCSAEGDADLSDGMAGILGQVNEFVRADLSQMPTPAAPPTSDESDVVSCHCVRMDRPRHRAWVSDDEVQLTPTEFKLLWMLINRPGHVLSRQDLASVCRGHSRSAVHTRTIDAHIKSIRRKLADWSTLIETVHGVGYRFRDK